MHIDLVKTFIIDWSNHQVMKFYTFKVCTVSVLLVLSPLLVCNITQYVLYDWIFYMNFFGPVQNFEIRLDLVEPKNSKLWLSNWFLGRISLQHIHTTTHLKKNHFLSFSLHLFVRVSHLSYVFEVLHLCDMLQLTTQLKHHSLVSFFFFFGSSGLIWHHSLLERNQGSKSQGLWVRIADIFSCLWILDSLVIFYLICWFIKTLALST